MNCPKCQFANPENAKFCNECGHSLSLPQGSSAKEPSFDEKIDKIQRYLPRGLTEKILAQRDRIEGERKQVTVMFCDMEDFTSLSEKLGPEESYGLMDQVYEILIHKVHDYEGTVNEMTGDGIMALFGAPIALEDAPQRAIRSAYSIHREMVELSGRLKQDMAISPIKMRIGIHTGPVVVGTLGNDLRVEFKAVGDTVNLASRMEGLAEPGTTYVTEETFRLTNGLFRFEALGKKTIKGKKEPIPVYKVLSAKKDVYRPRLGSERMIYSQMVGRDKELDKLELQVMKAINGEGSIVNIIGEAGIGKSRLVAELKKREVISRVTLLEGRAISIGKNLSFHPIIDLLKQWARIRADDGEGKAFDKLEAAVRNLYPEELGEVLPFVATLMGMNLSGRYAERIKGIEGEALEKLILKNVRGLLTKATELTPLVLVAEDLHWADTSSIEIMESLFRLAENHRILFILVFRPGHKETGDRILETVKERLPKQCYKTILLKPLDDRMSEALISNMLNITRLRHPVIGQIVKRAGGNPFYIEEIVRTFIDEGAVVFKDGTFEVTEKVLSVPIPHTVSDVLMTRIDGLEENTRHLVKVASVVGRNFFYRILLEVASTVDDIEGRLSHLKEIQLVRERSRMGEVEYLFKHALAQEAAYHSILPEKRKELHLKVADSIERLFGEKLHEFYGMLAYHYSEGGNLERAEEYLIKAGEEALKSSASNEALHYYRQALGLYLKKYGDKAEPERIAMMVKNIALALDNKGECEEAVRHFERALDYYWGELPKNPISAAYRISSGFLHLIVSLYLPSLKFRRIPIQRVNEAVDLFFKKLKAWAIINPKRYFIESLYFYKRLTGFDLTKFETGIGMFVGACNLFSFTGFSFRLSRKILDFAKDRVPRNDIKSLLIYDFSETLHNYMQGNWKAIKEHDDDLVRKNLGIGEVFWSSQHFFWHGLPRVYEGNFHVAKMLVNKLNDIFEVYDNETSLLLKQLLNSSLLMECRKLHEALTEIEDRVEIGQKRDEGLALIHMFSCRARINILMRDVEKARKALERANKIRREVDYAVPWQLSNFYRSRFEYDLYRLKEVLTNGSKTASFKYRWEAIKSGRMLLKVAKKVAQNRTESYRLKGVYYWLINKQKKALRWWNRSVEEGEGLGARLELSRTYFEVGKRLLEPQSKYKMLNGIRAEEYLEKARVLFEEMELEWDLDELDRLARG